LKKRINYFEKDDDDEEGEVDNEENDECEWKSNHTVINSGNSRSTIGVTKMESKVKSRSSKQRKPIINTAIKTRMRTIKTRMMTPKNTMKATGKTTNEASTLIKVNGQADTRIYHSGPKTDGIIWKNGNLRTRRNGQRPPRA
jgi:AAA15 family ATPase/GTPase